MTLRELLVLADGICATLYQFRDQDELIEDLYKMADFVSQLHNPSDELVNVFAQELQNLFASFQEMYEITEEVQVIKKKVKILKHKDV